MALDVLKWLTDDLKVAGTAEELGAIATKLTPAAAEIEKGYLRQADFSRKQDELSVAQTKLDGANQRLEAEIAEWATLQANGEQVTKKQREDFEKAQADVLRLQQAVRRMATDAGLDPEKALEGLNVVVKPSHEPLAPPDLSGYVKAGDLNSQLGALASMAVKLPGIFAKISREHRGLTGQDVDELAITAELERRANTKGNQKSLDPVAIWEELHDIPTKRTAAGKKRHDEEIAAAEQRGEERALSQMATPGPQMPQGRHAPVFQRQDGKARESVLKRPQPGSTHNVAVAALRTGKYRQAGSGHGQKTA